MVALTMNSPKPRADRKRGRAYSVMIRGAEEPQLLTYAFGMSSGDKFLSELPDFHVFVDEQGEHVALRDKDIVSEVSWSPQTEVVLDLSDSGMSESVPKVTDATEDRS